MLPAVQDDQKPDSFNSAGSNRETARLSQTACRVAHLELPNMWKCTPNFLCTRFNEFYKKGCQEKSSPSTGRREDCCLEIQPTAVSVPLDLLERFVLFCHFRGFHL